MKLMQTVFQNAVPASLNTVTFSPLQRPVC